MNYKEYKIHFLDSDEFDKLPYKSAPIALGLCDKKTKQVYARDTGNQAMDLFTVFHEIDHVDGHDNDEREDPNEPGVYYKKGSSWLLPLLAGASFLIPGVGPAIGGALGSIGSAAGGALTSLGMGGLVPALSQVGGALSGVGSAFAGAGSAAQGMLGMAPGVSSASNAGYAANAGRMGASMGSGIGSGTATGSAAASGFSGSPAIGGLAKAGLSNMNTLSSFRKKPNEPETMNQFEPSSSFMKMPEPQDPYSVQVGQRGSNQGAVGKMRSDMDLAQSFMRQKGFYAGRDLGGF